jgi:ParB family transcriptional regulator, chromosome partitioning protein
LAEFIVGASEPLPDAFTATAETPDPSASETSLSHDAEWLDRLIGLTGARDFTASPLQSIDALLADHIDGTAPAAAPRGAASLALGRLQIGTLQPRRSVDAAAIARLAASIAEQGVLEPLIVRPLGDDYEIIAGSRRYQAAKLAGLSDVPVIIRELSDREALMVALVENLQREDITALDEAQSYARLLDEFTWTQDELARRIGRSRSHISNTLRLLSLPAEVKALVEAGTLTAGHARALLNAPDPAAIAAIVVERGLSVRATEALVRRHGSAEPAEPSGDPRLGEELKKFEQLLAERLGLKVRVQAARGGGKLTIYYQAVDELDAALRAYGRQDAAPKASAAAAPPAATLI